MVNLAISGEGVKMSAVSCALALVEIEFAAALLQNNPHVSYLEW